MMGTRRNQKRNHRKERRKFESSSPGWPREESRASSNRDGRPSRRRVGRRSPSSRDARRSPPSRDARPLSRRDARPSRRRVARPSRRRDARCRSSPRRFARLSLSSFSCLSFFVSSSSLFCSLLFRPFLNYFLFSNIF